MLGNTFSTWHVYQSNASPVMTGHNARYMDTQVLLLPKTMEEPLIEQVPRVRCGSGLKPWYPEHKVVNEKIFIKLCKWDRSFTAFILGRSMDNRKGSGSLYFL